MYELAELSRKLENLLVFATVHELNETNRRLRVLIDDDDGEVHTTGWLPWPADVGRNYLRWRPLRQGTQVLIACPSGNLANGQVVGMLYTEAITPPSNNPAMDVIAFNDGTTIKYDSDTSKLTVEAVGDMEMITPGIFKINAQELDITADTRIRGSVNQTGGDITSDGIGVQGHHHDEQGDGKATSNAKA